VIKQVTRKGRKVWVIRLTFRSRQDGRQERYRRDARVQTRGAAEAEDRRVVQHWIEHGSISSLLVAPLAPLRTEHKVSQATWADAVKRYETVVLPARKVSTRNGYRELLENGFASWKSMHLHEITRDQIDRWNTMIIGADVSASRRRNFHVVMRGVLKSAVTGNLLETLPVLPPLPRVGRTVVQIAKAEDVQALLTEQRGTTSEYLWRSRASAQLAFALAAYAGLRASEVRGLRWRDVDLGRRTIRVRVARYQGIDDTPKSGHERAVPIALALLTMLETRPGKREADDFVATTGKGKPWGDSGLLQALRRACDRLCITGGRYHGLRHYFVTTLFENGVPAPAVQALAGHASLAVTQRYAHTSQASLIAAIATFGGAPVSGNEGRRTSDTPAA